MKLAQAVSAYVAYRQSLGMRFATEAPPGAWRAPSFPKLFSRAGCWRALGASKGPGLVTACASASSGAAPARRRKCMRRRREARSPVTFPSYYPCLAVAEVATGRMHYGRQAVVVASNM